MRQVAATGPGIAAHLVKIAVKLMHRTPAASAMYGKRREGVMVVEDGVALTVDNG
jgi:hypothetical protein